MTRTVLLSTALGVIMATGCASTPLGAAGPIERVERMAPLPEPFDVPDWRAIAIGYDKLLYGPQPEGLHFPLSWEDNSRTNLDRDMIGFPSYVGSHVQTQGEEHEAINVIASVLGASFVGIDKSNQDGRDYVAMMEHYFNSANGERLVLNHSSTETGATFWYEIYPLILFNQMAHFYPDHGDLREIIRQSADRWGEVLEALSDGDGLPNFDYTSFRLATGEPIDNGRWREPDAAAGLAWIFYMAHLQFEEPRYLDLAERAMAFLHHYEGNPHYEVLMPFGALAAARMNAELGHSHDLRRFVNQCFDPDSVPRPGWGVMVGSWNGHSADGLVGATNNAGGYAFAMNTFAQAGALVPIARYDTSYARSLGKWMLHVASNARLFYPWTLDEGRQSSPFWAEQSRGVVSYEGVRRIAELSIGPVGDYQTRKGRMASGTFENMSYVNNTVQILEEAADDGVYALEHLWIYLLPEAPRHVLRGLAFVQGPEDETIRFHFEAASSPEGPWRRVLTITGREPQFTMCHLGDWEGPLYVRAVGDDRPVSGDSTPASLHVEVLLSHYEVDSMSPFTTGDGLRNRRSATDYALYGASHVGNLGAIVDRTNNEHILRLDLLATDVYRREAYPTYLYYNPHDTDAWVDVETGKDHPVDLYDAVSGRILERSVEGTGKVLVPSDDAVVFVYVPSGAKLDGADGRLTADGVVIDFKRDALPAR